MQKTFDSTIDTTNRTIIESNLTARYDIAAEAAITIGDLINNLEVPA